MFLSHFLQYYYTIRKYDNTEDELIKILSWKYNFKFIKKDLYVIDYYLNTYKCNKLENCKLNKFFKILHQERNSKSNCITCKCLYK